MESVELTWICTWSPWSSRGVGGVDIEDAEMAAVAEMRGAKAAQMEAAVAAVQAALDRPNPTQRAISARLREARHVLEDYGEKHFILVHRVKDNLEQVAELKDSDAAVTP